MCVVVVGGRGHGSRRALMCFSDVALVHHLCVDDDVAGGGVTMAKSYENRFKSRVKKQVGPSLGKEVSV